MYAQFADNSYVGPFTTEKAMHAHVAFSKSADEAQFIGVASAVPAGAVFRSRFGARFQVQRG